MNFLIELGKTIFTPAIAIGAIAYVTKTITTQALSKDIETFKATLKQESTEHRVRYESIYSKRAEVVSELYKLIANANWFIGDYMAPLQHSGEGAFREKAKKSVATINELNQYYRQHRIYFSSPLKKKIDHYLYELRSNFIEFDTSQMLKDEGYTDTVKIWGAAWEKQNGDLEKLKSKLESDFRNYLGDR